MIYLDNASTTCLAPEVQEALQRTFSIYGNAGSLHAQGRIAAETLHQARATIAQSINAQPEEIIFTSGATEANNLAIYGMMHNPQRTLITSSIEHPSIYTPAQLLAKERTVTFLPVNNEGFINETTLAKITNKQSFVSIIHGNHEIGTIQPIKNISKTVHDAGGILHIDATQSYTKTTIDVKKDNIDLMTISSHKIHGPKGIGALYIKKGVIIQPLIHGGGQEQSIRPGTENVLGAVGFATAVTTATKNQDKHVQHMLKLRNQLTEQLLTLPKTKLNGNKKERLCNNINISFLGKEGDSLQLQLSKNNIYTSTGATCSTTTHEPSNVLKALGLNNQAILGALRITLSRYSTPEEMIICLATLKKIL
ncbi:MAG: cysteine desulfurase family protein [Nanoarchaeota archaeon]|nr:cysteine desulfurase family protein [Nanoarchaeota archaeon]